MQKLKNWTALEALTNTFSSAKIGQLETAGVELSWIYKTDDWNIIASHFYTDLLNLKLNDRSAGNAETAEPYGGSSDFINWATHQSKIYTRRLKTVLINETPTA